MATIQFPEVREIIDAKYKKAHDELTACYANKEPYSTYGVLSEYQFNKLHGLLSLKYYVEFHEVNLKQANPVPDSEYNEQEEESNKITIISDEAAKEVAILNAEGFDIILGESEAS